MSNLATFETILLLFSIGVQGWFFWQAWQQMGKFAQWIPSEDAIKIVPKRIPLAELTQTNTDQLLERFYQGKLRFAEGIRLPMLQAENYNSAARYRLFYALNRYLLKSRGVVLDFALIQNLVARQEMQIRQGLKQQAWIPLLIGVGFTTFGVAISLFFLPDLPDKIITDAVYFSTASIFFSGAKIIVLATIIGALLSLILLGWQLPTVQRKALQRKNEFLTLIQTEWLPQLAQDTTQTLQTLQGQLSGFQQNFMDNLATLEGLLSKNYETLKAQEKIAQALQEIDIMELAKANLEVFQSLNESAKELAQFKEYLAQTNQMVDSTSGLTEKLNQFLYRTQEVENVLGEIRGIAQKSEKLQNFLRSHFTELEQRSQVINNAVIKVDHVLDKSLQELLEHTQTRIRTIRDLATQEENRLRKAFDDNQHAVGKLALIEPLNKNIETLKEQNNQQQSAILEQLKLLNQQISSNKSGQGTGFFEKLWKGG
ncbi:hypothetical protein [Tunicatimonas pelagia]|uniref:hypothetical protein n=1 Tax=Tunicatimonas pelagia TaxID=931531 RepID=UPI002666BEF2|nr:hypothetical protein [Tunicatimonas pelagia]WKN46063.1 hypothetical protein P0M28_13995 [Tunicatimonas pelagia]